ncbi:ESX secretion-associated protein EspG [Williamsia sp.]|uniref:ESX secretion-associated protein EspG n=1 Tax=Williamsia sp. TaxID=1872085 RepID=UPI001A2FE5A8|nr:ESX secretion-associated protein EspG [Williamsia sp.]MBJ7288612.1 ESX secretion-associated protein EspG [Williamsia sp.]
MNVRTHAAEVSLSSEALVRLGLAGGVSAWPAVLDLATPDGPTGGVTGEGLAVGDRPLDQMRAIGLVDERARPTSWTEATLAVLGTPEAQIDICITDDTAIHRACLARRGFDHVFAVRSGDTIELSAPRIVDIDDIGRVVGSVFGAAEVARFAGLSVPTNELRDRLDRCECVDDYAACFCAVGATRADAHTMSLAFETCRARGELVATSTVDGVRTESSGTVSVYDTDHGRIIAEPSIARDGRMWTTIAPGSGDRMGHAVNQLLDTMRGPGWMP